MSAAREGVTVVLFARDDRARLWRGLAAVAAQTARPARVLVVDRASADGTRDWLRLRWPEVEHVPLPRADARPGVVLDAALARIDTGLTAFLDPGDALPRDALARLSAGLAGEDGPAAVLLPRRRVRRRGDRPPLAEVVPPDGPGTPSPLSGLCCRTERLRGADRDAPTLAGEILARLGGSPASLTDGGEAVSLDAAAWPMMPPASGPAVWCEALAAAGADLGTAPAVLLVGLDPPHRPAGLLDLLGHTLALASGVRPVDAFTLADLEWTSLEEAPAGAALVVTSVEGLGPREAARQVCLEELLRRAGDRPVRVAIRRLAPPSLVLTGRLIEAARRHPDLELWVGDAASRAYAAPLFGAARVRLVPPGIAGLARILGDHDARYATLAAELPAAADARHGPPDPDARAADLDAWHAGFGRDAGRRLGHLAARLAGIGHRLRTPALQESWSLLLPGWAGLAAGDGGTASAPLATGSLDLALFAALSGRMVELDATAEPGTTAFVATWRPLLEAAGLRTLPPEAARRAG